MKMMKKQAVWIFIAVIIIGTVVLMIPILTAFSAANTVPQTRADLDGKGLDPNEIAPPECAGMELTNIVFISAGETGTAANDLILGTDKNDPEIRGGAGNDCILGGKGHERQKIGKDWGPGIFGEEGDDVLIGGPGNHDHCDGGPGTDSYYGCETTY